MQGQVASDRGSAAARTLGGTLVEQPCRHLCSPAPPPAAGERLTLWSTEEADQYPVPLAAKMTPLAPFSTCRSDFITGGRGIERPLVVLVVGWDRCLYTKHAQPLVSQTPAMIEYKWVGCTHLHVCDIALHHLHPLQAPQRLSVLGRIPHYRRHSGAVLCRKRLHARSAGAPAGSQNDHASCHVSSQQEAGIAWRRE